MPLLPGVVRSVLDQEDSALRFERFSLDIMRSVLGVDLVPTSKTRDLGRDARSVRSERGVADTVLAASLSVDTEGKVESDLLRLKETTQFRSIVFITTRPMTEEALERLGAHVRKLAPATVSSVHMFGQTQVLEFAMRPEHEHIVRRYYGAEIKNVERTILTEPSPDESPETVGLRLALLTTTGDDARALRREISKRLVLEALYPNHQLSALAIANKISQQLHLPQTLSENYVGEIITRLRQEGLVTPANIALTDQGRTKVKTPSNEAAARLLEGRSVVRDSIRQLSGHDLHEDQFERVWNTLQDGLARLFYSHGLNIVRVIRGVLAGERVESSGGEAFFEELGDIIKSLFSSPEQGEEVRQAIIDMFAEKGSPAFEWLTRIAAVYVMMCALGLEALSGEQIEKTLSTFQLVVDSDIIISLLSEGESNHTEIERVIRSWRALGGKLLMAKTILEEVAHHAWISEVDFKATNSIFESIDEREADHLIENAFVRGFFTHFKAGRAQRRDWPGYIDQFRGRDATDYSKIARILHGEYGFEVLPESSEDDKHFVSAVEKALVRIASADAECEPADLDRKTKGKCARDAALFGAVRGVREFARKLGHRQTTFIVSSARLLRETEALFRDELGAPNAVISAAAVGALLTLTPGVFLGIGSLRGILFDPRLASSFTPTQRYAYRLIAASTQYTLPWSRRVTLQRELGDRLVADARASGVERPKLREKLLKSEDPEFSARIVSEALDRMAITPETEQEVQKLKREVERLREELRVKRS